ncbi:MAG: acetyl-CoA hydrolase/transferase C-terminal domain-containing protein [Desulfobacterales bacterium]
MAKRALKLDGWQDDFRQKKISPQEAAKLVKSGDYVVIPNEYFGVIPNHLVARRDELRNVTVEICVAYFDPGWLQPGLEDSFNVVIRCYLHLARIAHDEGRIPFIPVTNGTWSKVYRDKRPIGHDIDVFLVVVSPPDENGFCYFANGIWEKRLYARQAKTVIAEIDSTQPKVHGDAAIHISEIDYLVDITPEPLTSDEIDAIAGVIKPEKSAAARNRLRDVHPALLRSMLPIINDIPPELLEVGLNIDDPTDVMKAMAANLKTLVQDADTLQVGTGKHTKHLVDLGVFDDANDLGIFSELACPGMGFLVKRGTATGRYATLHPGKAVFTSFIGMNPEEIRWAGNNPLFEQYPGDYVINIANIARQKNMLAVNNAVKVDLTGQITCESQFGPRLLNGAGGQIEFHIGAFMSEGGKAVTFIPSTWGNGAVSNITPYFEEGTLVTISRYWADYVITEYGVAQLAGKSHRERAEELIRIAHPKFRDELTEAAKHIC